MFVYFVWEMSYNSAVTHQPTSSDNVVEDNIANQPIIAEASVVNEMEGTNMRANLITELFTAVRYGQHAAARKVLSACNNLVNEYDSQGYTCAHWAAKKGDIEMMQLLREFDASFSLPTLNDSKMLPIHWGASDGKVESIRFIITYYPHYQTVVNASDTSPSSTITLLSINALDSNGYTPVVIATQYNHPICVIYLIKAGCDMNAMDVHGDVALHWAAYKGYTELVGLLSYCTPLAIELADSHGQVRSYMCDIYICMCDI